MVVKLMLEPHVEPQFHPDSYGYRPGKSALDAVGMTRQRCWHRNWVIDLDIKGFFDNLDWDLVMRAVRHHTDVPSKSSPYWKTNRGRSALLKRNPATAP